MNFVLSILALALWPAVALAGPPQLPSLPGQVMQPTPEEVVEPAAPASPERISPAPAQPAAPSTPLQRPTSMPPAQPAPAPISAPASPSIAPAPIGPQPPPPQPIPMGPEAGPHSAPAPIAAPPPEQAAPELDPTPQALVTEEAEDPEDPKQRYPHKGAVADFRLGTLGCVGALCGGGRHDVRPGVRVGGFLGGNIRGWVELGVAGGWGTMKPNVTPGTNALLLYGLNPAVLQQALLAQAAGLLDVNLAGLAVDDAEIRSVQAGPRLRIHVIPRGRVGAFVGTGIGYNLLRTKYQTAAGPMGLDFHGVEVPLEANLSVYVLPRLAVGVQFDYMWTWYGLAVLDHPEQRAAVPMGVLQAAAQQQNVDLRGELPQMWNLGLALRGRL